MHMSNKVRTTLTLNKDVVIRAKDLDINLSAEAEKGIIDKIRELDFIKYKNIQIVSKRDFSPNMLAKNKKRQYRDNVIEAINRLIKAQ